MTFVSTLSSFALVFCVAGLAFAQSAVPDPKDPPLPSASIGIVDVTGAGGGEEVKLQKLAVVVRPGASPAEQALALIVRGDLSLSGQFEVAVKGAGDGSAVSAAPTETELAPFRSQATEIVVRVAREDTGMVAELSAQIFFPLQAKKEPVFAKTVLAEAQKPRLNSHRLTDAVIAALTGRAGAFASRLAFVAKTGGGQRVMTGDADGFGVAALGPEGQVALSPTFGPGDSVYYALSQKMSPFYLVEGDAAKSVPWPVVSGSILGLAFSPDRRTLALTVANGRTSDLLLRAPNGDVRKLETPPYAHHPAFGPESKEAPIGRRFAWVAGEPSRVFVDGRAISPAGVSASSPSFCESPLGLLVAFSLSNGRDTDIYVTDGRGNALRRLTTSGTNDSPACSGDGRLIAFFSHRKKDPGLYVMPVTLPSRAQRISTQLGSGLQWSRPLATADLSK